jgi:hypothetical protein
VNTSLIRSSNTDGNTLRFFRSPRRYLWNEDPKMPGLCGGTWQRSCLPSTVQGFLAAAPSRALMCEAEAPLAFSYPRNGDHAVDRGLWKVHQRLAAALQQ